MQEQALYAWFDRQQAPGGVLLSAPTGTGKTLVAEAVVFEALKTGTHAYYSTPLIALTDQKFEELQATAERWGYPKDAIGLVTGHRTINPDAPIKVVVAEVLLNRLLHPEAFDFQSVSGVVMDEFHNFNDPERGIVWELALTLLPPAVRVMLLSATVGAATDFTAWMRRSLKRDVALVEGRERKVPLTYHWIGDELLPDFLERISKGAEQARRTPALVFCFDRAVCWDTAEVLKGRDLFAEGDGEGQRDALFKRLDDFDFTVGSGNKLRTFLARGIGIHHAGLLPRYRRVVETLFQEKLLPICVCTETLAAGLNLPARSVILTTLVKGPPLKRKLIDPSSAQQIFGRAGRPQFDTEGYVYTLAHEDDVKLAKWQEKYDSIPETEKDPKLMAAKKAILKKKPTRRQGFVYWNPEQFVKLQTAPPVRLASRGRLSWRWLAYLLQANPDVEPIRAVIRSRLMDQPTVEAELKRLTKMLVTLHRLDIVTLNPAPPPSWLEATKPNSNALPVEESSGLPPSEGQPEKTIPSGKDLLASLKLGNELTPARRPTPSGVAPSVATKSPANLPIPNTPPPYDPITAIPTPKLQDLTTFRAVHPLYGLFLLPLLAKADDNELIQILESLLEIPGSVARSLRVPRPDELPPGPLTTEIVDPQLLTRGLVSAEDLSPPPIEDQLDIPPELRKYPIPLADKVKILFESEIEHAGGLFVTPVWALGDLLQRGGNFDQWIRARDLLKQEGILFKHALRMVLLCDEFEALTPQTTPPTDPNLWRERFRKIAETLTGSCREVDPQSTDETLEELEEDA